MCFLNWIKRCWYYAIVVRAFLWPPFSEGWFSFSFLKRPREIFFETWIKFYCHYQETSGGVPIILLFAFKKGNLEGYFNWMNSFKSVVMLEKAYKNIEMLWRYVRYVTEQADIENLHKIIKNIFVLLYFDRLKTSALFPIFSERNAYYCDFHQYDDVKISKNSNKALSVYQ